MGSQVKKLSRLWVIPASLAGALVISEGFRAIDYRDASCHSADGYGQFIDGDAPSTDKLRISLYSVGGSGVRDFTASGEFTEDQKNRIEGNMCDAVRDLAKTGQSEILSSLDLELNFR